MKINKYKKRDQLRPLFLLEMSGLLFPHDTLYCAGFLYWTGTLLHIGFLFLDGTL